MEYCARPSLSSREQRDGKEVKRQSVHTGVTEFTISHAHFWGILGVVRKSKHVSPRVLQRKIKKQHHSALTTTKADNLAMKTPTELRIDRFHVTSLKSNFYSIHSKPSPKSLDRYEVFIRSYRHLNFVVKSPVRHAFGNYCQRWCKFEYFCTRNL